MHYISEEVVIDLVQQADVITMIARAYAAMADGSAVNFPVVREVLGHRDAIFGFKSGFDRGSLALGVKAGGLWPGNRAKGLANHQSTIVLFDSESGSPIALVRATHLTALRTAAASAISIDLLARRDARVLGILGAGGQAATQIAAALPLRGFDTLWIADQSSHAAAALAQQFAGRVPNVHTGSPEQMARASDVIITVTPSFAPIICDDWIRPGTHLACMGADTRGKQEVESALVARAALFVDDRLQAATIGECQHALAKGQVAATDFVLIGDVVRGAHPGRSDPEAVTLFDSTGVGLQDIAAARLALDCAIATGRAIALP